MKNHIQIPSFSCKMLKEEKTSKKGGENLGKMSPYNWEFETITQHTLDILIIVDQNQIVRYVTPSIEILIGYKPEWFIGQNAFDPLYPEDKYRLIKSHREVIETGVPKVDEYRVIHLDGSVKFLESRVTLIPDHPDKFVVVSIRDITARKNMERELEKRKNRYQDLQNSLKNYSQDLANVTKVFELKEKLIQELITVLPSSEPQVITYHQDSQMINGELPLNDHHYLTKLVVGKLRIVNDKVFILLGEHRGQTYILTMNAVFTKELMDSIWLETLVNYTIMVFDSLNVIENLMNQLETALIRNEKPQWILRLLFHLSEKQRSELSSDLNDTVLENQIDLYKKLQKILKEYPFEESIDAQLKGIIQGLLDTIHQIRLTCNELRPPLLRELGLERALESLFEQTQVTSTYKIDFSSENTFDLSINEEETIGLYRVVQELLNNASKHSQATNLSFHLEKRADWLELQYSDNGKGLNVDKLAPTFKSMGLSGMRERVQSFNGTIDFRSEPGNGLMVKIQIPIS
jgi:two-component system, NarL family, sensor histidine kinase ComP